MTLPEQIKLKFIDDLSAMYGIDEAEELFWLSLEHVSQLTRFQLRFNKTKDLSVNHHDELNQILNDLKKGEPFQYILGYAWFFNQQFKVNKNVLIPRPETEELVALILEENKEEDLRVLDIGTGSGCIPITLKKHLKGNSTVFGVDISEEALAVARLNARDLDCVVNFNRLDILDAESVNFGFDSKFDIIVSNPPYITPSEKLQMHTNVLNYEPHLALFVDQESPLIFYQAIASFAMKHLKAGGRLYFEINKRYGSEIMILLKENGFRDIQLKKDMAGNDRMVSGVLA